MPGLGLPLPPFLTRLDTPLSGLWFPSSVTRGGTVSPRSGGPYRQGPGNRHKARGSAGSAPLPCPPGVGTELVGLACLGPDAGRAVPRNTSLGRGT